MGYSLKGWTWGSVWFPSHWEHSVISRDRSISSSTKLRGSMPITSQSDWKPYHCFLGSSPTPQTDVSQTRGSWAGTRHQWWIPGGWRSSAYKAVLRSKKTSQDKSSWFALQQMRSLAIPGSSSALTLSEPDLKTGWVYAVYKNER